MADKKPTRRELQRLRRQARERFLRARKAEVGYMRQLKSVGRQVGRIIKVFAPEGKVTDITTLREVLSRYSHTLEPWAKAVASRMIAEVAQRDEKAWLDLGRTMGREIARELNHAPTGFALKSYLDSQVELITSLPLTASQKVHEMTVEALSTSARAEEIAQRILNMGHTTESRAALIARTEVARTASAMTMVRAQHLGSEGYIWRTTKDSRVRESHHEMEGKFVRWSEPPRLSDGTVTHAGMIYNCRCWPEPVIPDTI